MVKFRPIVYNEGDFRAYKWVGTDGVLEGIFGYIASADQHTYYVKEWSDAVSFTSSALATLVDTPQLKYGRDKVFPVYREDPDIENVGATISQNDMVIGFHGNEYEVHYTTTYHSSSAETTTWAVGTYLCIATNSKLCVSTGTNHTDIIIGECLGVYNGWVRVRRIG